MCKKQCGDENGFKNHCTTEGHLRNMEKFSSDSDKYIESFSREFEKSYLDVLSHHHHTKRVNANYVYNELIQDKSHVHMNATKWDSLASFVRYLGETGKCEIEETERGWFVKWIDPEEIAREVARRKRDEADARLEKRRLDVLLRNQKETSNVQLHDEQGHNQEEEDDGRPVESEIIMQAPTKKLKILAPSSLFASSTDDPVEEAISDANTALREDDAPTWLLPGIIVRINSSKVGPSLKNEKAVVLDVRNDHADLIILKSGQDAVEVPSKRLESVIPAKGGRVVVLGLHKKRGLRGHVEAVNPTDSRVTVLLDNGDKEDFDFEDVSKLFEEDTV